MKRYIADKKINFYTIDAVKIAQDIGLGGRINMIMQSAFFALAQIIPTADATKYLKDAVEKSYGNKGQSIVTMNNAAIDLGVSAAVKINVPASWSEALDQAAATADVPAFIANILVPMNRQEGDKLPVSAFIGMDDGTFPSGSSAYEKRGIAIDVPEWQPEHCIQCNQCAFVCPHASIRPALLTADEAQAAPEGFVAKPATGIKDLSFHIAVSPLDCAGCGNCAQVCPAKQKALVMKPIATQLPRTAHWDYALQVAPKANPLNKQTVKGSQFEQPLLEFSGACAGCGETPYAKLITQLFGDRMMIANATGCTSIWGASAPSTPYTTNHRGHGPSWANSLFEDNAEYGLGMFVGVKQLRDSLAAEIQAACSSTISAELKAGFEDWLANRDNSINTRERADKLVALLEAADLTSPALAAIYKKKDLFVKRSHWIFGGDGWAYDIGYGGVDHVLASGEDVNIFVFDTEVYSNTGGQSSKATPTAAIAKFAASGKRTKKKDLGMMAMSYGYVYVAQICMGADKNQALKAIAEAEAYPGPSLIIAYSPCINHGLKAGMGNSQLEAKKAVESGYWATYRYNPALKDQGKNPFSLDSKEPTADFKEFLMGEVRYSSLKKQYPEQADALFDKTQNDAAERLASYKRLANVTEA
jgi:pyruvate-ferredoxin/flavodoxin oxidoreductase